MRVWRSAACSLAMVVCTTASVALAASEGPATATRTLVVGVWEAPPFSFRNAAGQWEGISIDLWQQVATSLRFRYDLVEASPDELILKVSRKEIDVSATPLAITLERERVIDFTHVYYTSGLGIVVKRGAEAVRWQDLLKTIFSRDSGVIFGSLFSLLLLAGAAMWLLERKRNAAGFSGGVLSGIGDGFWWSGVTFTGVGYGDKVPVTLGGRLVALVWMLVSVVCVSALTATVTAKLSIGHMSEIRGHQNLGGHLVGAVEGTASQSYLRRQHIRTKLFPTTASAIEGVATGQVDAFVHDVATLKYLCHSRSDLTVLPEIVENENYGFIVANGSPLREGINVAMLAIIEQPMWRDIKQRYLSD
jgi:polar amino acid transport system substrate-binding protein